MRQCFFAISFKKRNIIRWFLQMTCKFSYYFDRSMRIACNYHIHQSIRDGQRWECLMMVSRPVCGKRISESEKIFRNFDFAFFYVSTCCRLMFGSEDWISLKERTSRFIFKAFKENIFSIKFVPREEKIIQYFSHFKNK